MFNRMIKNQKGLTLIELLVVVVILGIISAIAVPSVGGLIENSRQDAHLANAQQMLRSARLYDVSNLDRATESITLDTLEGEGYIEEAEDPWAGVPYNKDNKVVVVEDPANNSKIYKVYLADNEGKYVIEEKESTELDRSLFED